MNCRKASSLLSAYIDRELTGAEMLEVEAHVAECPHCREELDEYQQTKRLLARLAYQAPRADLEKLLLVKAERATNPSLMQRILPPEWTDAMLFRWEGTGNLASPRLRPLAGAALLSLAGLCLVSAGANRPGDELPTGSAPMVHTFTVYVGPTGTLTRVPVSQEVSDMSLLQQGVHQASMMPMGTVQRMTTPSLPTAVAAGTATAPASWEGEYNTVSRRPESYSMPLRSSVTPSGSAIVIWATNR